MNNDREVFNWLCFHPPIMLRSCLHVVHGHPTQIRYCGHLIPMILGMNILLFMLLTLEFHSLFENLLKYLTNGTTWWGSGGETKSNWFLVTSSICNMVIIGYLKLLIVAFQWIATWMYFVVLTNTSWKLPFPNEYECKAR
jgi:hypothetical protein